MDRVVEIGFGDVEAEINAYKDSPFILKMLQGCLQNAGSIFSGGITGEAVDLGCGDGQGIEIFCNDYPSLNWTGIDSSSFAISAANSRKLASSFSSQMTFTEADFTSNTTEYDFCFSCNALHHISTGLDFWNAVKASTKSGGKIYIVDFIRVDNESDIDEFITALKNKGVYSTEQFYIDAKASFKSCFTESEINADLSSAGLSLNVRVNDMGVGLPTVEIYGTK
jgi:SAM-dependent methyltransferase